MRFLNDGSSSLLIGFASIILVTAHVARGQNFETGDNSTVRGCSTHCSYHDRDPSCWNKNQEFFERLLLAQMRHYIAVQINIDQFNKRHQGEEYKPDFDGMRERSIQRISSYLKSEEEDEFITRDNVAQVVGELMKRVANRSAETIHWMPHYSCPLPCEYRYNVWRNLFIVSMVLNAVLIIAVVPYVYRASKRDASEALL